MSLVYIHFEPCPKCSEGESPFLGIAGKGKYGYKYRAKCRTCLYEQQNAYDSVEECSEAWNKESNEAWQYTANNDRPSRQKKDEYERINRQKKYENKVLIQKLNELEQD